METLIINNLIFLLKNIKDQQKKSGAQLVVYDNPEVNLNYKGKDSIVTLGQL